MIAAANIKEFVSLHIFRVGTVLKTRLYPLRVPPPTQFALVTGSLHYPSISWPAPGPGGDFNATFGGAQWPLNPPTLNVYF